MLPALCAGISDVVFLPISGRLALNLETPVAKACPWWDGPCLLDVLDTVKVPPRDPRGPLRYVLNPLFANAMKSSYLLSFILFS